MLVHLYEERGERLVERLRGMFAFALWDRPNRRLLLARDRMGIKPLYIYRDDEKLIFGSEPKAILAHPGVPREVDAEALEDYLAFGVVLGSKSIFKGIEQLDPGHTLLVEPGRWDRPARRYWRLEVEPDERPTADEWREAVAAKLDETVRLHLIADVPIGAFLSGGLDSSVDRGGGGRVDERAAPNLLDGVRRGGLQRAAARPEGGRAVRHPAHRGGGHARTPCGCSTS